MNIMNQKSKKLWISAILSIIAVLAIVYLVWSFVGPEASLETKGSDETILAGLDVNQSIALATAIVTLATAVINLMTARKSDTDNRE